MPNRNYLSGRRFEYKVKAAWEAEGWKVLRTAGSHGEFDLIAYRGGKTTPVFIQCKRVTKEREADKMLSGWKQNPPHAPLDAAFNQCLEIFIKETRENVRLIL